MGDAAQWSSTRVTGSDVLVVGLGGMGSAAAYRLAARGLSVVGLERFGPAHDRGSSHGGSRITRQAYFEDPAYVPLLRRASELWDATAAASGRDLVRWCGGVMVGPPDGPTVAGTLASARAWGLEHEVLDAAGITARFPTMRPAAGEVGVLERRAGTVHPEESVRAHLDLAAREGADLHFGETVLDWRAGPRGVEVVTDAGRYAADRLVVAPGAWAPGLTGLDVGLQVERYVQFWLRPDDPSAFADHPVYIWEGPGGRQFYGFPAGADGTVKVAFFRGGAVCDPTTIDRTVHPEEGEEIRRFIAPHMPVLGRAEVVAAKTCMYTCTPDHHFVIAPHPDHERVTVACGFSGHGFKFVPVVGEILADLAADGATPHPIGLFDPARFGHLAGAVPDQFPEHAA